MGVVVGMDEAGYGPKLGPLVVAVTGWEVPGPPTEFDFWRVLRRSVTQRAENRGTGRLHIADSKVVYSPARGLAALERSVLALLAAAGYRPRSFSELCDAITAGDSTEPAVEPWCAPSELSIELPMAAETTGVAEAIERFLPALERHGVRFCAVHVDAVGAGRFNRITQENGSKGHTLTSTSLKLLGGCWRTLAGEPDREALVLADRHGGRSRYLAALVDALDGHLPRCLSEQPSCSRYRVGRSEFRFETKAERHFPVAAASMIAKYVRELSMEAFNRFWSRHVTQLKPTRGYPTDADRFRRDIAAAQQRLRIADEVLWRER